MTGGLRAVKGGSRMQQLLFTRGINTEAAARFATCAMLRATHANSGMARDVAL